MAGRFLTKGKSPSTEHNVFADKSAAVLAWLLSEGLEKEEVSIREAANQAKVSLGLAQRVFGTLAHKGYLSVSGVRTAKKFALQRPDKLLRQWRETYDITKKCRFHTYSTGFPGPGEAKSRLMRSKIWKGASLALHSAAKELGYGYTNLDTLEVYLIDKSLKSDLEKLLQLEPRERGYEVLLIEPYYKYWVKVGAGLRTSQHLRVAGAHLFCTPPLLTYLDLYNFPLRGREGAEHLASKNNGIKEALNWNER